MYIKFPEAKERAYGLSLEGRKCHCGHEFVEGEPVFVIDGSPFPPNWHGGSVYFCARCLKREGLIW